MPTAAGNRAANSVWLGTRVFFGNATLPTGRAFSGAPIAAFVAAVFGATVFGAAGLGAAGLAAAFVAAGFGAAFGRVAIRQASVGEDGVFLRLRSAADRPGTSDTKMITMMTLSICLVIGG